MDAQNTVIPSNFFDKREITLADDDIVVVACMRNEGSRLPYFLDYYRRLGATRFLLVDNASSDGTRELLMSQPDVEYFHTETSFRGSAAGRLWNHEIAETYAVGHWVLTPDLDELFVYPGAERLGLPALCRYLDEQGYDGVYAPMIDMYSDLPLSQTRYEPGSDFLSACPFFDTDSYSLAPITEPPFLGVFGGPRGQMFAASGQGRGPLYIKVPLVKWRPGHSYIRVAHTHRALQLADVTGAMLHFKFFSTWEHVVANDVARGDRRSANAWTVYADHSTADLCFFGPHSRRYNAPRDLVRLGVMAAPEPLHQFLRDEIARDGDDPGAVRDLLPAPVHAESRLTLRSMAALWPIVQNPAIMRHFSRDEPRSADYRIALVQELRGDFAVVDIRADHILVRVNEPALHRWRRSGLALAAYVGDRLAARTMADGSAPGLVYAADSLEANVCRWELDVAGVARQSARTGGPVRVSVYLYDAGDPEAEPPRAPRTDDPWPAPEDAVIFSADWHSEEIQASPELGLDGVVHTYEDGEIRGWVYDSDRQTFDVPVTVYVDGRVVCYARPNKVRRPLAEQLGCPPTVVGRGFRLPLPLGYFRDAGNESVRVEVRVAGTNVTLRQTPLDLPSRARTARWRASGWRAADDASHDVV